MDDLQHFFLLSRTKTAADLRKQAEFLPYQEYESLPTNRAASQMIVTHCSQHACNENNTPGSPWHQALEKLEEKRKWRRVSAEISKSFSRWLARNAETGHGERHTPQPGADIKNPKEKSLGDVTYTKVSASHIFKQSLVSTVEVNEVSAETDSWDPTDAVAKPEVHILKSEVRVSFAEKPTTPGPSPKNLNPDSKSRSKTEKPESPPRPPSTPSTATTSSSSSPVSQDGYKFFGITPATPESFFRSIPRKDNVPQPESSPLAGIASKDRSSKLFTKLKQEEPLASKGDIFSQDNWKFNWTDSFQPQSSLSTVSIKQLQMQEDLPKDSDLSRTLFPHAPKDPSDKMSLPTANTMKVEFWSSQKQEIKPDFSQAATKSVQKTSLSLQGSSGADGGATRKVVDAQLISAQTSRIAAVAPTETKVRKSPSMVDVFDIVIRGRARVLFDHDPNRCFAPTKRGRCKHSLERRNAKALAETLEELGTCDDETDSGHWQGLAKTLINLTHCVAPSWSDFPGHYVRTNQILAKFRNEAATFKWPRDRNPRLSSKTSDNGAFAVPTPAQINQPFGSLSDTFTGFELWQPQRTATRDTTSCLRDLIEQRIELEYEQRNGYIYAYRAQGIFGFVKIGFTTRSIPIRLSEWERQCRHKPMPILSSQGMVPHIKRVEGLIHTELKNTRHLQTKCVCGVIHEEWFAASPSVVSAVVDKWSKWMETRPYDFNGFLRDECRSSAIELCKPESIIPAETAAISIENGHVKGLEKKFEFISAGTVVTSPFSGA